MDRRECVAISEDGDGVIEVDGEKCNGDTGECCWVSG